MITTAILIAATFFIATTAIALRLEIGARSRAWRRIAEERRWDWERRIESSNNRSDQ